MAFATIPSWSTTAGTNTEIDGISLAENVMVPSAVNNAFREMMSQVAEFTRRGSDLASADPLNLDSIDTMYLDITGSTTVSAVTLTDGHSRRARATGAFQLTASATLVVNGSTSSNYTTTAGDLLFFEGYGSSTVRVWAMPAVVAATTSVAGIVELATAAEALTGTDTSRAVTPSGLHYPTGYLSGLTLSNNATDGDNDIDIATGVARDGSDTVNMKLASALTKKLDASWAVGTDQGMLDGSESVAGTPDTSTWYHIWLIKRSDTGVVDVLASESATAPTMPTNYDYKRRLGAVFNNSSGNIVRFLQDGDDFILESPTQLAAFTNPGTSADTRTLTGIPTGIQVQAIVIGTIISATTGAIYGLLSSLDAADITPTSTIYNMFSVTTTGSHVRQGIPLKVRTNTSAQIRSKLNASGAADVLYIMPLGWTDRRGR